MVGEVLLTSKEHKIRNWRSIVASSTDEGPYYSKNGAGRNRVSAHPAGRCHGSVNIDLATNKSEVYRVTEKAISSPCTTDKVVGNIQPREQLVDSGKREVGANSPADQEPGNSGGFELD